MKRVLCLLMAVCLCFSGCDSPEVPPEAPAPDIYVKGVWFTYSEINSMLNSADFKREFQSAADNCKSFGITDAFIHIRAFCDSIYKSRYFPLTESARKYNYDVFEYMIGVCKDRGIRVHAWINPYRIKTGTTDFNTLPEDSIPGGWLLDQDPQNDINICFSNGIYLNPASGEAQRLIIDGIKEVLLNYPIDGIHFDDYFYPTTDPQFDKASYENYAKGNEAAMELPFWRRANVNALIGGCYAAIKFIDKDIIFSISPAASVGKNYSEYYADVSAWVKSGCVDWVIPQLYFGFEYPVEDYCFEQLLSIWKNTLASYKNTRLIIGLAAYKVGTDQEPDNEEWGAHDDILLRQTEICAADAAVSGHIFFSYSSLFSGKEANKRARELLMKTAD